jgi:hypothetical protein
MKAKFRELKLKEMCSLVQGSPSLSRPLGRRFPWLPSAVGRSCDSKKEQQEATAQVETASERQSRVHNSEAASSVMPQPFALPLPVDARFDKSEQTSSDVALPCGQLFGRACSAACWDMEAVFYKAKEYYDGRSCTRERSVTVQCCMS